MVINLAELRQDGVAEFGSDAEIFGSMVGCENYRQCQHHGRTEQCLDGCLPQECPRKFIYKHLERVS